MACQEMKEKRGFRGKRKRFLKKRGDFFQLAGGDLESYWRKNAGTISASYGFSYVQGTL